MLQGDIKDYETEHDKAGLQLYADELRGQGYSNTLVLGYGNPKKVIPELTSQFNADLLVLGAHGHRGISDLIFGTTINAVRHRVNIPILVVK